MKRLAIIVRDDAYDRILTPLAFAWLAAASDTEVDVLLVNWAARLVLPGEADRLRVSSHHAEQEAWLRERVAAAGLPASVGDLLRAIKETGRVRFWVCSLAAQVFGVTEEEALPLLDGIMGATTFLYEKAAAADLTMTF
jgi:peroxiredoxin family protein